MQEPIPDADGEIHIPVREVGDIVTARLQGRLLAESLGFSPGEATLVATAISELARNIVQYATTGEIAVSPAYNGRLDGIVVVARDQGPGIVDMKQALLKGFSKSGGLGLGLSGVQRIMDEFHIESTRQIGTTIRVTKWKA